MTSEYPRTVTDHRGTVWACCESAIGRPCAHELHQTQAPPADTHLQYCRHGQDITGSFYAAEDATEVRAWTPDGTCLGAVMLTPDDTPGVWVVCASDVADWPVYAGTAFEDWRTALAVIMAAGLMTLPAGI